MAKTDLIKLNQELKNAIETARLKKMTEASLKPFFGGVSSIVGAQGPKGDKGDKGEKGQDGKKGEKGEKGDRGDKGDKGEFGPAGVDGLHGKDGRDGKDGKDGKDGRNGLDGTLLEPEQIRIRLEKLSGEDRLDASAIKNLPEPKFVGGRGGGGISELIAGTGIELVRNGPRYTITSTVGTGSGDVVGPAGATADNIAVYDGATGKIIKDGGTKISDLATTALYVPYTGATTNVNLGVNNLTTPTIYGSSAANGDLTIQGTSDATKTTSYVILQPTAGNVGVGTAAPGELLSLSKNSKYQLELSHNTTVDGDSALIRFRNSSTATVYSAYIGSVRVAGGLGIGDLVFGTSPSNPATDNIQERMRITSTGNVGIGTTSPQAKLQINGDASGVGLIIQPNVTTPGMSLQINNTGGTSAFSVDRYGAFIASGNAGVGGGPLATEQFLVVNNSVASRKGIVVRGLAGQTGNLQEWQSSDKTALTVIDSGGSVGIGTTSPKSTLHVSGSFGHKVVTKVFADTGYTAASETVILCNAMDGAITINLPVATNSTDRIYHIKKIDASANTVTIDGNAGELIDGETTQIISGQYDSIQIVCDGSNWYII